VVSLSLVLSQVEVNHQDTASVRDLRRSNITILELPIEFT